MKLKICWLFPNHLNIYGDRGNILTLKYRCQKRGIKTEVVEINSRRDVFPQDVNLIFGGGGQDKQQEYVSFELQFFKKRIHELIHEHKVPALTICGTYQLFGHYFKTFDAKEIKGISVFDAITVASTKRKIGNVVVRIPEFLYKSYLSYLSYPSYDLLVGFENHSGNTYLSSSTVIPAKAGIHFASNKNIDSGFRQNDKYSIRRNPLEIRINPFGKVIKGYGNNGEDGYEGAIVENCIGTYMHGPILPKNPALADFLLLKALQTSNSVEKLQEIDDSLEWTTREKVIKSVI